MLAFSEEVCSTMQLLMGTFHSFCLGQILIVPGFLVPGGVQEVSQVGRKVLVHLTCSTLSVMRKA